jgi:alpha-glucosidase
MVDFTNPQARDWFIEKVIRNNVVQEAKAAGWMHDFGEYLPFDAVLYDGSDPIEYHTRYVDDWASLAKNVTEGTDLFYFMRAGTATSPSATSLFWMGDQLPTFDKFDGLHSALIGQLNGALCGFTLTHSDIGGYTNTVT